MFDRTHATALKLCQSPLELALRACVTKSTSPKGRESRLGAVRVADTAVGDVIIARASRAGK